MNKKLKELKEITEQGRKALNRQVISSMLDIAPTYLDMLARTNMPVNQKLKDKLDNFNYKVNLENKDYYLKIEIGKV